MSHYTKAAEISGLFLALMVCYGLVIYFNGYTSADAITLPQHIISRPFLATLDQEGLATGMYAWEKTPTLTGWIVLSLILSVILFAISLGILYIRNKDKKPLS